jgi:hypothetical protein
LANILHIHHAIDPIIERVQIPYLIFMVSKPCCPSKISFKNVNTPSQTMGVMSTPNAGGTAPLINFSKGSVGQTANAKGNSLRLVVGYHEMTTRHSMAKENTLRNGPRTFAKGWTHGSVSERRRAEDWRRMLASAAVAVMSATGRRFRLVVVLEPAAVTVVEAIVDRDAAGTAGAKALHPGRDRDRAATATDTESNKLESMIGWAKRDIKLARMYTERMRRRR